MADETETTTETTEKSRPDPKTESELKKARDDAKAQREDARRYRDEANGLRGALEAQKAEADAKIAAAETAAAEREKAARDKVVNADLRLAAKDAGANDVADVLTLLPRDKLTLNDDGEVANAADLISRHL